MAKAKAEHRAELLNKFVMVPPTAATDEEISRCPICKETFQNEYSEEEEDWVWRNCVEIDGKVSAYVDLSHSRSGLLTLCSASVLPRKLQSRTG